MSEMATRLSDGRRVKIGTCKSLFYCRWDQRNKINYPYMTTGLRWRLPLPEEDEIEPGDFDSYKILRYDKWLRTSFIPCNAMVKHENLSVEQRDVFANNVGFVQTTVDALGLLVNLPCYHGMKLPENVEGGAKFFWNGKRDALYFSSVINNENELKVIVECAACGKSWSMPYQEAEPLFYSLWMKLRLLHECADYWYEHNYEPCPYVATVKMPEYLRDLSIRPIAADGYTVYAGYERVISGGWEQARDTLISLLPDYDDQHDGLDESGWNSLCCYGDELKQRYFAKRR